MKSPYLVVARSGEKSLHMNWLKDATPNFDLVVTFYGNSIPDSWSNTNESYDIIPIKGGKWRGLYQYFKSTDQWREYDYILLPDDDLLCSAFEINRLFEIAKHTKVDLCQPALDGNSYFSHVITLKHESFNYRLTNFVELMIPCLSRRMLEATLELFDESNSGWGMDRYWWELICRHDFMIPMIFDDVTITHTRPVGSAGHGMGTNGQSPHDDLKNFCIKYDFTPMPIFNMAGKLRHDDEIKTLESNTEELKWFFVKDSLALHGQVNSNQITNYILNQQKMMHLLSNPISNKNKI